VTGVLLGAVVAHETLTPVQVTGVGVVLLAVVLATASRTRGVPATPPTAPRTV
jgi:drug/metabolite transporter (DMT)-like permease